MERKSGYVDVNGLLLDIEKFLRAWAETHGARLIEETTKRDTRYWNDGPTAYHPTVALRVETRSGFDRGVFQIWRRNDGFGVDYEYFTTPEWEAYNPSDEAPDAIKREIGLCKDYQRGI